MTSHPLKVTIVVSQLMVGSLLGTARETSSPAELQLASAPKYLVLDSRVIDTTRNARLTPGTVQKNSHNPLFGEDKPWEPRFDNLYPNVAFDEKEGLYKCWYTPFIKDKATVTATEAIKHSMTYCQRLGQIHDRESGLCYATSTDGIVWQKQNLGVIEYNGSSKNNLVKLLVHGAGIVYDPQDPDTNRRFKMFAKTGESGTMAVCFSHDGVTWSDNLDCSAINVAGDTHNNAFWDKRTERYVGITRMWRDEVRVVARTESPDFVNWQQAKEVFRGTTVYRMVYAMPVFPYANVYLGLEMIIDTRTDTVECELAWSPDTLHWHHVAPGMPLIPRGAEGTYDCGCIYAAAYPVINDDQICLYYGGGDGPHCSWRKGSFCLATLGPDRFAGFEPVDPELTATIITQPIHCRPGELTVTADAAGGSLRVAVLDSNNPDLEMCCPISEDVTDHTVTWKNRANLASLQGKSIRLKFELKGAKLYAFGLGDSQ
jgi:hypothetical protein